MKKVLSILLCVLWMGFIFYNSSQDGTNSNGLTNKIVDKLITIAEKIEESDSQNVKVYASPEKEISAISKVSVNSLLKRVLTKDKVILNKAVRKAAHAFEFLILAVLLCNAFFVWGIKGRKAIIYILFIVLFYAVTDEFHQIYVVGRGSSVKDVLIDFTGGVIGILFYYLFYYVFYGMFVKINKKR